MISRANFKAIHSVRISVLEGKIGMSCYSMFWGCCPFGEWVGPRPWYLIGVCCMSCCHTLFGFCFVLFWQRPSGSLSTYLHLTPAVTVTHPAAGWLTILQILAEDLRYCLQFCRPRKPSCQLDFHSQNLSLSPRAGKASWVPFVVQVRVPEQG